MERIKINKKSLLYLGVILIIILLVFVGLFFLLRNIKRKPEKSIIDILSVPGNQANFSEEFIKTLSVPSSPQKQHNLSEDLIKSLSAPAH